MSVGKIQCNETKIPHRSPSTVLEFKGLFVPLLHIHERVGYYSTFSFRFAISRGIVFVPYGFRIWHLRISEFGLGFAKRVEILISNADLKKTSQK
jgi:hypothetical protein